MDEVAHAGHVVADGKRRHRDVPYDKVAFGADQPVGRHAAAGQLEIRVGRGAVHGGTVLSDKGGDLTDVVGVAVRDDDGRHRRRGQCF